ncbi:hypothetical protein [Acanthopleuribacter pedis]|uniref:Uncharacterized protein n=1 Tax=Acanthopleuribacter pedis TaxID=442870 RepID=A0A8J7U5Q8_9BACT|nr:hypothetical protein [Acanthopleuribacter pedis]MBO1319566.1 hypothetical protein [Acanthopleuribacter pedis]
MKVFRIGFLAVFLLPLSAWQGDETQTLFLRDGSQIKIKGDYQVSEHGVSFTRDDGREMMLPHSAVDLEQSQKVSIDIGKLQAKALELTDPGSAGIRAQEKFKSTGSAINDEISAHREKGNLKESMEEINQMIDRTPGRHQTGRQKIKGKEGNIIDMLEARDMFILPSDSWYPDFGRDFQYRLDRAKNRVAWLGSFVIYGFVGIGIVTLLRNLWLLVLAYQLTDYHVLTGVFPGLVLLLEFISFRNSLLMGLGHMLIADMLFGIAVFLNCLGQRRYYLPAIAAPYLLGMAWGGTILYFAFAG